MMEITTETEFMETKMTSQVYRKIIKSGVESAQMQNLELNP